jgi:cell division protein ZapA (FtsZ GTPase activity inhibitor)
MLNAKEISVGNLTYVLRSDESESHLDEVVGLVEGSVDALRAKHPGLSMQNATLLAACDLASQLIRGRQQARAYQSAVLERAGKLLEKVEKELVRKPK